MEILVELLAGVKAAWIPAEQMLDPEQLAYLAGCPASWRWRAVHRRDGDCDGHGRKDTPVAPN